MKKKIDANDNLPRYIYKDEAIYWFGVNDYVKKEVAYGRIVKRSFGESPNKVKYQLITIRDKEGNRHQGYHYYDEENPPVKMGGNGCVRYSMDDKDEEHRIGLFEPETAV